MIEAPIYLIRAGFSFLSDHKEHPPRVEGCDTGYKVVIFWGVGHPQPSHPQNNSLKRQYQ